MGLSGRKDKQRIPNDPRNLSWADDASRFGTNYLAKFGWDSGMGLGAGGEGRTSHIKVSQKLDMMGIGAAGHQNDPNGIAWKQNKDFESLLKRLNEANEEKVAVAEEEEEEESGTVIDGFVKAEGKKKKKEKKEKRKREEDDEGKCKKKARKNKESAEEKPVRVVPRHRSHRARHIAAKSLACKSAAAISEILGIAPSSSAAGRGEAPTMGGVGEAAEQLRTSSRSVEDYLREKMRARGRVVGE